MAHIKPLTENLQKVANNELGEVPARIPEDLQALKFWIQQQPHLKACTDDQFLIQFLRGCKFSLERAKEKLDLFYTLKTKYPELFAVNDIDNKRFQEILKLGCQVLLPVPLNDYGPRILVFRVNFCIQQHGIEEVFQPFNVLHEVIMLNDPYACIYGMVYIMDMAKSTASIFLQFTPGLMKKLATYYETSLPLRIKFMYFINVPAVAEQFFKILLPMLSKKLQQRIIVCGKNMSSLTDRFPLKYLPQDYGGENGCLDEVCTENYQVWSQYRDYFKQNADFGTDERLRPGNPIDFDSLFGMGGSFRKLDVD